MMNDQEMQFADPEWQPAQRQNGSYAQSQPYNPRPINDDRPRQEQPQWEETPERVYKAQELPPYQAPPYQPPTTGSQYQYGQVRSRRRRSPWLWIVTVLIVFSLLGTIMSRYGGSAPDFMPMKQHSFPAYQQQPSGQKQVFSVDSQAVPTIVINDAEGDVQIQGGNSQGAVVVQTDGPDAIVNQSSPEALSINTDGSEDVTVTVPNDVNLTIISGDGDVNVDDVSGQMTLNGGSGDITMQGDTLTGDSIIKSSDGDITFQGQLDPSGSYQFISTGGGSVDLTLPSSSAFSLAATTSSGSIDASDFSQQPQQTGSGATLHGNVGNAPRALLTITTNSGDISLSAR
ncbi:MAG TPA: DUF4097 family beta strand repeat-containing protein [Ktedonobacteraceae bacterium]|nr:DUF4097 family beta strand repeat-containing protein [Ktedonobacteraceae bacterium]